MTDDQVSLREYLERVVASLDAALSEHKRTHDVAMELYRRDIESKLEALVRTQDRIATNTGQFVTHDTYDAETRARGDRLSNLERANFVTPEQMAAALKEISARVSFLERANYTTPTALEPFLVRLATLENWKAKATGAAVILTLLSGAIGAAIFKVFGG